MARDNDVAYLNGELPENADLAPKRTHPEVPEVVQETPAASQEPIECDVLVVGAGISGITAIHRFRKLGLKVKCFESGGDFGGVWYWNRYPGARVDTETPFYQFNIPEVYRGWHFKQRFPGYEELRDYMAYVDKTLDLRRDVTFGARVVDASWSQSECLWTVKTQQGHVSLAKYMMLATGLLHRTYTPEFPGVKEYKGHLYHSGAWSEDFDGKGKKIGLIGAGASAVQITQELGKQADELTVFLRRPSYCLPLGQRNWTADEQRAWKSFYPALFKSGRDSAVGIPCESQPVGVLDVCEKKREAWWENLWARGGFNFLLCNYNNVTRDKDANELAYQFWRSKVCQRLTDLTKQKTMAPDKKPYFFGTKRCPLEQDYYEVLNQSNVFIHDLSAVPLKSFYEKGLVTSNDKLHEFDAIVLATGFESYPGSLTSVGLKDKDGVELTSLWEGGISTYLGITISGFPNLFMAYTPQGPATSANGPTVIEAQVETIGDMIAKLEKENVKSIEPRRDAAKEWKATCDATVKGTLLPYTNSWWNGGNVPGKKAENVMYAGGLSTYEAQCREKMDGWKGFDVVTAV